LPPATLVGVDAEAAAHIGAQLHERTDRRLTQRKAPTTSSSRRAWGI
jgi:cytidylate kinase